MAGKTNEAYESMEKPYTGLPRSLHEEVNLS